MPRGFRTNRENTVTTEESTVSDLTTDTAETNAADETTQPDAVTVDENATPATTETTATRAARPALEVGEVVARVSSRTDLKSRPSPTESNPVYLAVKGAEFDVATDLVVDPDKVENVKKILRRAAQPDKLNVGMTIYPGAPEDTENPGKVIVTFAKHAEKTRKAKGSDATGTTES